MIIASVVAGVLYIYIQLQKHRVTRYYILLLLLIV